MIVCDAIAIDRYIGSVCREKVSQQSVDQLRIRKYKKKHLLSILIDALCRGRSVLLSVKYWFLLRDAMLTQTLRLPRCVWLSVRL